jgi:hypothetical protein
MQKRMPRLYPGCLHVSEINKNSDYFILQIITLQLPLPPAGLGLVKNCGGYGLGYVSEPVDGIKTIENAFLGEHQLVCRTVDAPMAILNF